MSKFAKKSSDTVTEKKEAIWTNDPALQDQESGKTTEKGAKFKKAQDAKTSDKEAKTAPKKDAKPAKTEKAAPKKDAKPATKEKAKPAKTEKAPAALDTRKITVVAKENPKRGTAAERFALYKTGMTVEKYIAAGGKQTDISWDVKQGFIKVA